MTDSESEPPPAPPLTLARLRDDGATVLVRCLRCSRQRELDPADVTARVGWETVFPDARARASCGGCGERTWLDVRPLYPGTPPGTLVRHS